MVPAESAIVKVPKGVVPPTMPVTAIVPVPLFNVRSLAPSIVLEKTIFPAPTPVLTVAAPPTFTLLEKVTSSLVVVIF